MATDPIPPHTKEEKRERGLAVGSVYVVENPAATRPLSDTSIPQIAVAAQLSLSVYKFPACPGPPGALRTRERL